MLRWMSHLTWIPPSLRLHLLPEKFSEILQLWNKSFFLCPRPVAGAVFNTLQLKAAFKARIDSASSREAIGQMLTEYPPSACPSPREALREHRGTEPRSSCPWQIQDLVGEPDAKATHMTAVPERGPRLLGSWFRTVIWVRKSSPAFSSAPWHVR